MNIARRGFLQIATMLIGGVAIGKFIEPEIAIAKTHKDWIEDRGGFYIVRVPDFKTFSRERLDKPTIFLLGDESEVSYVDVTGYANFDIPKTGIIHSCSFDGSKMHVDGRDSVVILNAGRQMPPLYNLSIVGNHSTRCAHVELSKTSCEPTLNLKI